MVAESLEKAALFLFAWREAGHLGENAMMGVAFCVFNRVRAYWDNGDWLKVIEHANQQSYTLKPQRLDYPDLRDPIVRRFLARIDSIYDGTTPDTYASVLPMDGSSPDGLKWGDIRRGKYWATTDGIDNPWFLEKIRRDPSNHPRTSTGTGFDFFA